MGQSIERAEKQSKTDENDKGGPAKYGGEIMVKCYLTQEISPHSKTK